FDVMLPVEPPQRPVRCRGTTGYARWIDIDFIVRLLAVSAALRVPDVSQSMALLPTHTQHGNRPMRGEAWVHLSLTPFRKEIGDVDGLGLALRAEICTDDGFTPNKALLDKMVDIGLAGDLEHNGKKIGLVLDVGGWYRNVITFAPSLDITHEEIDLAISLLDQLLTKAKKGWSPVACCKRKARREIAGPFALPHPFRGGCPPVSIYLPVVRCMGGRVRGQGVRRPKPEGAPVVERGWRSFASAAPIGILQLDTEPLAMKNTVRTVFRPFAAGLVAILIGMHGPASRAADVP